MQRIVLSPHWEGSLYPHDEELSRSLPTPKRRPNKPYHAFFAKIGNICEYLLSAWQRGFGTAAGLPQGDANGDGTVDGVDLAIWKSQFGLGGTSARLAGAAVPEPSTLGLLAVFFLGLTLGCIRVWKGWLGKNRPMIRWLGIATGVPESSSFLLAGWVLGLGGLAMRQRGKTERLRGHCK